LIELQAGHEALQIDYVDHLLSVELRLGKG
jgi:hypothetical protein